MAALALCCASVVAIPSGQADAQVPTVNLVCFLSSQLNFSPPLNFNTSHASAIVLLSTCVSPNGRYPQLQSAIVFGTNGAIATGCSPLPLKVTGDGFTGFWNDGSQSTFNVAVNTDLGSKAPLGFIAHVTTGTMAGSQATAVPVIAQNGLCLFGGVRSLSAFGVVAFTQ